MMNRRLRVARTALALAAALAGPVWANPFETALPNGMKLIVKEDRRAPSVVHMVWYRVGAMDEVDGTSGVAHLLEHMMFKGTKKLGPGEFNKQVAAAGGRDNAFTSHDYTAYFQQVPREALGRMMALEADRMAHLQITEASFRKEIEVVKEERRLRTDDKPRSLVVEQLMATAFQAHPYRRPVIGWMSDLENMTAQDARDWYQRWYVPNNATLVVVGDVDHQAVFKEAAATYGRVKARPLPVRKPLIEPEQTGSRRTVVKAPAELPYVALAWRVPSLRDVKADSDFYALQVLAAVLDGYEGARLAKNIVRGSRIAVTAGAGYDGTARGESLFYLDGAPAAGRTPADVEAALKAEIERIQNEGVSEDELRRVKAQAVAGQVYKRDSLMGQAMEIGMDEMVGHSWKDDALMLERIRAVTAAEVQAVARKYFRDETLTVAQLDPLPVDPQARAKTVAPHRH
ncbi:pitrilysin family protein [Zoogloea sp.]|jgi:zinc protease|uniref:M16 family metallopeptidase n=1 Tax=Zoogloea sp. TaxID=49181 RepID=UPI001B4C7460|nr:pitrilysin family protein [Zoogloea sp.]MBK6656307.1 insulinase family protein [Zoogloea sp.]MBP7444225.1 insulinase family protein [Zoogloea sp.]HPI59142.1 pitrilysin family protein [Zoogloea sp.]